MDKVKKVILLSHCVLNEKSKVKKSEINPPGDISNFLNILLEKEIGIIQLPCPELTCYGLKRWGHVKEQFDTIHYRKHCRNLFNIYLDQLKEYIKNDYEIVALIGIEGSPTCGIYKSCTGEWMGEIGSNESLPEMLSTIKLSNTSGILMEEIKCILDKNNIEIPYIDFNKNYIDDFLVKLKKLI
ncbi:CD3072 family TudS-related putative desulfidase [Dethiothermospora halolimnae]|uniref:CD3072 family TudS-related putative desulfidase n=1 Tax=Dethiothermospora halolimnae TaxID=3114390 RepID=UPI003CCC25D8